MIHITRLRKAVRSKDRATIVFDDVDARVFRDEFQEAAKRLDNEILRRHAAVLDDAAKSIFWRYDGNWPSRHILDRAIRALVNA